MAVFDKPILDLPEVVLPVVSDTLYIVDDVAATPTDKNITVGTLLNRNLTSGESTAGLTESQIDVRFDPGDIRRYGDNAIPGTTDMTTAIQNAITSDNGFIDFQPEKYNFTATLTTGGKNVWFRSLGQGEAILELSTIASLRHGIHVTGATSFLKVTNLSINTKTALTTNESMNAIRMDAETQTSIPVGSRLIVDHVNSSGFNIGVFAQGDTSGTGQIEYAQVTHCKISTGGTVANNQTGPIRIHRSKYVVVENNDLDANDTGDHATYHLHDEILFVRDNKMRETQSGAFKAATEGAGQLAPIMWVIDDNDIFDDEGSNLIALTNAYDMNLVSVQNNNLRSVDDFSDDAAFFVGLTGTSRIRHLTLDGMTIKDTNTTGITIKPDVGTTIDYVHAPNLYLFNFSSASAGTNRGMTTEGAGTISTIYVSGHFDGNSNGRAALQLSNGDHVQYGEMEQINCTAPQIYEARARSLIVKPGGDITDSGQRLNILTRTAVINSSAAATLVTSSSFIPAGSIPIGVTIRVTTAFGTSTGLTSFDVGDGTDVDRWGATIGITLNTTTTIVDFTTVSPAWVKANSNVTLTANGGNFDATGQIRVTLHYINLIAATS